MHKASDKHPDRSKVRNLIAMVEAIATNEPADVIGRFEQVARANGANEVELDSAVEIGILRRRRRRHEGELH